MWWGASIWIIVTLVFVVLAFILAYRGTREPNRR